MAPAAIPVYLLPARNITKGVERMQRLMLSHPRCENLVAGISKHPVQVTGAATRTWFTTNVPKHEFHNDAWLYKNVIFTFWVSYFWFPNFITLVKDEELNLLNKVDLRLSNSIWSIAFCHFWMTLSKSSSMTNLLVYLQFNCTAFTHTLKN